MKRVLKDAMQSTLPDLITNRKDKMGFPVPIIEWFNGEARDFIHDIYSSKNELNRELINNKVVLDKLALEPKFGRTIWGLFCLELWQQEFHDRAQEFHKMVAPEQTS